MCLADFGVLGIRKTQCAVLSKLLHDGTLKKKEPYPKKKKKEKGDETADAEAQHEEEGATASSSADKPPLAAVASNAVQKVEEKIGAAPEVPKAKKQDLFFLAMACVHTHTHTQTY